MEFGVECIYVFLVSWGAFPPPPPIVRAFSLGVAARLGLPKNSARDVEVAPAGSSPNELADVINWPSAPIACNLSQGGGL